jgi:predicted negative regulator of RcsB-dependent stress response
MSEQYDEHEQSERVKQWLLKNGSNLLTVLLLLIASVFGWHWWQNKQNQQSQEAGNQYQTFLAAVEKPDPAKAQALGDALMANYAKTDYAFLAALRMAKLHSDGGQYDKALAALNKASGLTDNPQNLELASLRKTQLWLAQGNIEQADKSASAIKGTYYPASLAETKADIAAGRGDNAKAITLYREALSKLDADASSRALIELKLSDAGGTVEKPQEIR